MIRIQQQRKMYSSRQNTVRREQNLLLNEIFLCHLCPCLELHQYLHRWLRSEIVFKSNSHFCVNKAIAHKKKKKTLTGGSNNF